MTRTGQCSDARRSCAARGQTIDLFSFYCTQKGRMGHSLLTREASAQGAIFDLTAG